jgi:DNA-binding transcriptional MerR regulator
LALQLLALKKAGESVSLDKNSIGNVALRFDISVHTLRYYEKIGLLPPIAKDSGGRRTYSHGDTERLQFIRRAQRMHFSLKEIANLINIDRAKTVEKAQAQKLVAQKLSEVDESLRDLRILKKDLSKMLDACISSDEGERCPILEGIKQPS